MSSDLKKTANTNQYKNTACGAELLQKQIVKDELQNHDQASLELLPVEKQTNRRKAKPTGRSFNILGFEIEQITIEPCHRVSQYMKREEITCQCADCLIDNAGLTNDQIRARMDKAYK